MKGQLQMEVPLFRLDTPCLRAVVAEREQGVYPPVLVDPSVQVGALGNEECLDPSAQVDGAGCGAVDLAYPPGDARVLARRGLFARSVPVPQVCVMYQPAQFRSFAEPLVAEPAVAEEG